MAVNTITNKRASGAKELKDLYFLYPLDNNLIEIYIKDIIPESLSYSYSPQFSGQGTLGRMSPIQIYSGGSAKEYSFNLIMHEDMLINTNFDTLIDFVDAIKSLSYPAISNRGSLKKPKVEFHLGEIVGLGIVNTSISWQKPFVNGHYVMADISFKITLEEILPQPKVEERIIEEEVVETITYRSSYSISEYYEEFLDRDYLAESYIDLEKTDPYKSPGVSDSISDFVSWEPDNEEKIANIKYTAQYFDLSQGLFEDIYNNFTIGELDTLDTGAMTKLNSLQESVGLLGNVVENLSEVGENAGGTYRGSSYYFDIDEINNEVITNVTNLGEQTISVEEILDNIENEFTAFLDYYYDNVDTDMTKEEYDRAIREVKIYIDNMRDMFEEVYSYAPSN